MYKYRPDLKQKARVLRRNMTDAERRLWHRIRGRQIHDVQFYRQKPLGKYIVDFFAPKVELVIEVDGAQHRDDRLQAARDRERDDWLARQNIRVLRFDNREVLTQTRSVLEKITSEIEMAEGQPSIAAPTTKQFLEIAVGVLMDGDGRVLIAERRPGTPGAGKWEFPGGKREQGEAMDAALARELHEELGVDVTASRPLLCFMHDYDDRTVLLDIRLVTEWRGQPYGREGQELAWCAPERLYDYDLLSANKPVVDALRLPDRYAFTPEPDGPETDWLARAEAALDAGVRLLRLRAPSLEDADYESLARRLQPCVTVRGAKLLLDRDFGMCERVGAAGLHWPIRRLQDKRPVPRDFWFAVSCHNRDELERALTAGADFATLSPVAATPSHPDAEPLGWVGFENACRDLPLPVFALGGLGPEDLETAWRHGAQGIAGIRRL